MYTVYRWFKVSDEWATELLAVFCDESTAIQFSVSYAMLHQISVDQFDIRCDDSVSLEKIIDEVMFK